MTIDASFYVVVVKALDKNTVDDSLCLQQSQSNWDVKLPELYPSMHDTLI